MEQKIWAHSGDSHFLEPENLFQQILPPALAERMPYSVKEDGWETVHIDGEQIRRPMPKPIKVTAAKKRCMLNWIFMPLVPASA